MNLRVGKYGLGRAAEIDSDSRGLVWMWEPPKAGQRYVVACDPSYGIAGWDRSLRTEDDVKTDNCAVEVIRIGRPDVQVAEYAAPIDAEEAAAVVNFLGRIYGESDQENDGQALAIIEVQPGPGLLTQRELQNRFGYTNLFVWQHLDQHRISMTPSLGWYSSRQSRQMLWIRGTRHINKGGLTINSPWLVEEMVDLVQDNFLSFTARAQWGAHDDRMLATLMGIWAANQWSWDNPVEEAARPELAPAPEAQCTDSTIDEMDTAWNDRFNSLFG